MCHFVRYERSRCLQRISFQGHNFRNAFWLGFLMPPPWFPSSPSSMFGSSIWVGSLFLPYIVTGADAQYTLCIKWHLSFGLFKYSWPQTCIRTRTHDTVVGQHHEFIHPEINLREFTSLVCNICCSQLNCRLQLVKGQCPLVPSIGNWSPLRQGLPGHNRGLVPFWKNFWINFCPLEDAVDLAVNAFCLEFRNIPCCYYLVTNTFVVLSE